MEIHADGRRRAVHLGSDGLYLRVMVTRLRCLLFISLSAQHASTPIADTLPCAAEGRLSRPWRDAFTQRETSVARVAFEEGAVVPPSGAREGAWRCDSGRDDGRPSRATSGAAMTGDDRKIFRRMSRDHRLPPGRIADGCRTGLRRRKAYSGRRAADRVSNE